MNKKARINYIHALSSQVERKKMYKAKKQWVVAGISFLVATGMGAIGSHLTTHADTTQAKTQTTLPINKGSQSKQIGSAASNFHNKLVSNVVSPANQKLQASSGNQAPSAKSSATPANNKVNDSQVSSSNAKTSSVSNGIQKQASKLHNQIMSNNVDNSTHVNNSESSSYDGHGSASINNSVNSKVNKPLMLSVSKPFDLSSSNPNIPKGTYDGLNYKYNPVSDSVEFTSGTLNWDRSIGSFIGDSSPAPQDIQNATSIKFDNGIQNNMSDLSFMFNGATAKSIDVSGLPMNKATNIRYMFANEPNVQAITFGNNVDTSNVKNMGQLFGVDPNLKVINNLSDLDTSNVTYMESMFNGDKSLSNLTFGKNFNTNKVTDMKIMFQNANIPEITIQSANTRFNSTVDLPTMYQKDDYSNYTSNNSVNFNNNSVGTFLINKNVKPANIQTGNYDGLNYEYNSQNQKLEFTSGTLNWNRQSTFIGVPTTEDFSEGKLTESTTVPSFIENAKSVVFDKGIKNNDTNLNTMFYGAPNIQYIDLTGLDLSHVTSMSHMLAHMYNLRTAKLNGLYAPNNKTLSGFLGKDYSLQNVDMSNDNFQNTTAWDSVFMEDPLVYLNLKGIYMPNAQEFFSTFSGVNTLDFTKYHVLSDLNTTKATNTNSMFSSIQNNPYLSDVNFGVLNMNNVSDAGMMFGYTHSALKGISDWNPQNLSNAEGMFGVNPKLKSLDLSKWNTPRLSNMESMFNSDTNLQSLKLGTGFNTSHVNDMRMAFIHDNALKNLTIASQNTKFDSTADLPTMYKIGTLNSNDFTKGNLGTFTVDPYQMDTYDGLNYKYNPASDSVEFTSGTLHWDRSGSFIGEASHAPQNIQNATSIKFDNGIQNNMSDLSFMFNGATAKYIDISGLPIDKATSMHYMFALEPNVQEITLGSDINTSNVTNMGQMFGVDPNLKVINNLSDLDTNNVNTMESMFYSDKGLSHITFGKNFNTNKVTDMNMMFKNANIPEITIQSPNTKFNSNSNLPLMYQKDENDNYTSTNANDFNKGNVGTFLSKKNLVKKVANTVAFYNQSTNNLVGKVQTINGNDGSQYTLYDTSKLTSGIIPRGYHLVDKNGKKITSETLTISPNTFDHISIESNGTNTKANHDIPVKPLPKSEEITYKYKNTVIASDSVSGNDFQAQGAKNTTFDANSKMPKGYQLAQGQSDNIDYNGKNQTIKITPIQKTDTINYQLDGKTKGTYKFSGNDVEASGADKTTLDISSANDAGIPSGYQLVSNNNNFNYDGKTHDVAIESTNQTANVDYKLPNGNILSRSQINGDIGKSTMPSIPSGYHATSSVSPYKFKTSNNQSDVVSVAPNTINGTAIIHIKYDVSGHTYSGSDQKVSINGQYGQSDQVINPVSYQPTSDDYSSDISNKPLDINFNQLANGNKNISYNKQTTFTYDAQAAPSLVIRYDDTTNGNNEIHSATFTPSDLENTYGVKPQDWVVGNTLTFGKVGTPNAIDVIQAPTGYQLISDAQGFDYQNGTESITLEPNTTVNGKPVVLMAMPMLANSDNPVNPSNANKPASAATSISMDSSELSSLASEIGGDINVTVRPNVTNTTVDNTELSNLTSEVATNNQEISSLANKPTSNANINYNYFDNLINDGINKLTSAINTDIQADIHNTHNRNINIPAIKGKKVHSYMKWLMIVKPLKLYNSKNRLVKIAYPHNRITLNVKAAYKVHNHIVFKISYRHHSYFIKDNNKVVRNAYLPKNHNLIGRKVRVLHTVYAYKHKVYDRAKTLHQGFTNRVKNIVKLGNHNVTRIQLTNGLWISANKNFIKILG